MLRVISHGRAAREGGCFRGIARRHMHSHGAPACGGGCFREHDQVKVESQGPLPVSNNTKKRGGPGTTSGKRTPQRDGGPKRPASHSGRHWTAARAARLASDAIQDALAAREPAVGRPCAVVKAERGECTQCVAHLEAVERARSGYDARIAELESDLASKNSRVAELEAALSAAIAKNTWYHDQTQNMTLDLEWAMLYRRDKKPPPTAVREHVRKRISDTAGVLNGTSAAEDRLVARGASLIHTTTMHRTCGRSIVRVAACVLGPAAHASQVHPAQLSEAAAPVPYARVPTGASSCTTVSMHGAYVVSVCCRVCESSVCACCSQAQSLAQQRQPARRRCHAEAFGDGRRRGDRRQTVCTGHITCLDACSAAQR